MLSAVLTSPRAIQMSVIIIRAFVKLREILATRIEMLEANQSKHGSVINILANEIDNLKTPSSSAAKAPHGLHC